MSSDRNIIIVLVASGWLALSIAWHWFRSRSLLKQWAKANRYELVEVRMPWSTVGPFFASRRQGVYQIRVRDETGREHSGWAKCGGFWLGLLVDKVEVEWGTVHKTKPYKRTHAERQTIKVQVARVVNFVCKWVVIGVVGVLFFYIYWWAKWHR